MKHKEFVIKLVMLSSEVKTKLNPKETKPKTKPKKKKKGGKGESLSHKLLESMALLKLSSVQFSRASGYLTHFNGNSLSECPSRDQMVSYLEMLNW